MIQKFHAVNYKGLRLKPLELGRVNLFVGPNNCGKSNLFSAMSFLLDLFGRPEEARGSLEAALRRRSRGPLVSREVEGDGQVVLDWDSSPHWQYRMTIDGKGSGGAQIVGESVHSFLGPNQYAEVSQDERGRFRWFGEDPGYGGLQNELQGAIGSRDSSMLQIPLKAVAGPNSSESGPGWSELQYVLSDGSNLVESFARRSVYLRLATTVPDDVVSPQLASSVSHLDDRGLNLVNLLHALLRKEDIRTRLCTELLPLIPGLEEIGTLDAGGYRFGRLRISGAWRNLSELSDGTITALLLAVLLFGQPQQDTLLLDEPELNLHPAWARTIGTWVLRQQSWSQVLLSTHSPEVLDAFTEHVLRGEARLFVFQRGDAGYEVERCPPERLEPLLSEGWTLGDLYRVGEPKLGGWPW